MEDTDAYVLAVTSAAVLCAIVTRLMGEKGTTAAILRMVCGIIMASAILTPLGSLALPNLSGYFNDLEQQVSAAVAAGADHTKEELSRRILQKTHAYIQDKASELGVTVEVFVELDDGSIPAPARVEISGAVSPAGKMTLSNLIEKDLGIRKEDQIWK